MDNKETHFTHFTLVFSLRKYRLSDTFDANKIDSLQQ